MIVGKSKETKLLKKLLKIRPNSPQEWLLYLIIFTRKGFISVFTAMLDLRHVKEDLEAWDTSKLMPIHMPNGSIESYI